MSGYARLLHQWISFNKPAPEDVLFRLQVANAHGHITQDEYRTLLDTPIGEVKVNAPGGAC